MKQATRTTLLDYQQRICRVMNWIQEHLDQEFSLEELAQVACFSPFHFHRIFKAMVGETVFGFVRRLRLESAANLLRMPCEEDITQIALSCGFATSQSFAKAFRAHFGESASDYRSKHGYISRNSGEVSWNLMRYSVEQLRMVSMETKEEMMKEASVKEMPTWHVAYIRKIGKYGPEVCGSAFEELMRWAGPRGFLANGPVLGIYWDNPEVTPPQNCRTDACVVVPTGTSVEAPFAIQDIQGGPHAVCSFELKQDQFPQAWEEAFRWLIQNGYECDNRPTYELYGPPKGDVFVVDICIPIKSA